MTAAAEPDDVFASHWHLNAPSTGAARQRPRDAASSTGASQSTGRIGAGAASGLGASGTGISLAPPEIERLEGTLYQQGTVALIFKRWRPRFALLHEGVVRVWENAEARMHGGPPLTSLRLGERMALTPMKTAQLGEHGRVFYRSVVELSDADRAEALPSVNFTLKEGGEAAGTTQLLQFGCESLGELETWSKAIRAGIQKAHAVSSNCHWQCQWV